jgi:hypothetical protein
VDAVIRPAETRSQVNPAPRALRTKRQTLPPKKHGNIHCERPVTWVAFNMTDFAPHRCPLAGYAVIVDGYI